MTRFSFVLLSHNQSLTSSQWPGDRTALHPAAFKQMTRLSFILLSQTKRSLILLPSVKLNIIAHGTRHGRAEKLHAHTEADVSTPAK